MIQVIVQDSLSLEVLLVLANEYIHVVLFLDDRHPALQLVANVHQLCQFAPLGEKDGSQVQGLANTGRLQQDVFLHHVFQAPFGSGPCNQVALEKKIFLDDYFFIFAERTIIRRICAKALNQIWCLYNIFLEIW